jgi:Transmembrane secretion effector
MSFIAECPLETFRKVRLRIVCEDAVPLAGPQARGECYKTADFIFVTELFGNAAHSGLHIGPAGLGILRSAPAVGACVIALIQAHRPTERRAGAQLFAAVAIFGVVTLIFAFSTSYALSLAALFVLGASDMVSVNIRSSLVQLATPDAMRGRVSAVNMLFIGASSELGAFESGLTAALLGTMPAVALGGLGTLAVAAVWLKVFPALRRVDRLRSEWPPSTA